MKSQTNIELKLKECIPVFEPLIIDSDEYLMMTDDLYQFSTSIDLAKLKSISKLSIDIIREVAPKLADISFREFRAMVVHKYAVIVSGVFLIHSGIVYSREFNELFYVLIPLTENVKIHARHDDLLFDDMEWSID